MTGLSKGVSSVLVTGGCGFIGINLVSSLAGRCDRIRVLDDLSVGSLGALKREWSAEKGVTQLEFIRGDVREREVVEGAVQGVDAVVHLAQSGVLSSIEDPSSQSESSAPGECVFDRDGIKPLLEHVLRERFGRLSHLWLDAGYPTARAKARTG
jgi:NAD(P)-dependent dehydrogenase (short-subunit alcohol dehydrogenase family)